jgi:hypothetical protein
MQNKQLASPDAMENQPASPQGIDYMPKRYTVRQQVTYGGKLAAMGGIIFIIFWLFEAYLS